MMQYVSMAFVISDTDYLRQLLNTEQDLDRALSLLVLRPVLLVCLLHSTYCTLLVSEHIGTVFHRKLCIDEARTRLKQLKVKSLTEMWLGELLQTSGFLSLHEIESTCATRGTSPQLMSCVLLILSPCKCSCQLCLLIFEIA